MKTYNTLVYVVSSSGREKMFKFLGAGNWLTANLLAISWCYEFLGEAPGNVYSSNLNFNGGQYILCSETEMYYTVKIIEVADG